MYLDYFGLSRLPFSIAPDPDLLYLSPAHHEALAHLNYALTGHGGLICLTGEVGMGKTTLCRAFIDQAPAQVSIAYIFNPVLSGTELLQAICQELEIPCKDENNQLLHSNKQLFDALYQGLIERYSQGKKVICIIDEAQSMPAPLLEQIRLLTNLETNQDKLLTLILVGQPELQETLAQHGIRQLDQRITARFHLKSMDKKQLPPYLQHRLKQAGCDDDLFKNEAIDHIWKAAKGIPRLINSIADRALLGAYATGERRVSKKVAQQAAIEVLGAGDLKQSAHKRSVKIGLLTAPLLTTFLVLITATLILTVFSFSHIKFDQLPKLPLFDAFSNKNHYELLASANGLNAETGDLTSCQEIQKQTTWRCLSLDWPLVDLKRLQRPIAVFDGEQWSVQPANDLLLPPVRSVILWQPMQEYGDGLTSPIKPGSSHPLVIWVREQIKLLESDGMNTDAIEEVPNDWQIIAPASQTRGQQSLGFNEFYDPLLATKIADFQKSVGLMPDRIIGLKTLLTLQDVSQGAH